MLGAALIGDEELKELQDVVREQSPFRHYGIGSPQKVNLLEQEARAMLGVKYALAVSSGTAALSCALAALEIGPGDEVIVPAFGWFSDYSTVVCTGALPVFADIDDTLNMDPDHFAACITPRTKAVIVIHYQGAPARMNEIMAVAGAHNIKVIEDCAQAFGGSYQGRTLGTLGDIAIVSFQGNKVVTSGEGGLLYTNSELLFVKAVRYHDLGFVRPVFLGQLEDKSLGKAEDAFAGLQFRMSELQAAFLLAQLRKLPFIVDRCRTSQRRIKQRFKDSRSIVFRDVDEGECGISLFMMLPTPEDAAAFAEALAMEGIPIGPSSSCTNMLERTPITTRKMYKSSLPPFGKGHHGEHTVYDSVSMCPAVKGIVAKYVCVAIGVLYSDEDIDDIIGAIAKVEQGLFQ
ncbi:DegT/DnrJ/EryC1/StrS family aminotransferase [Paenibacillus cymbidii]|uniref:DegT/DnrJ/EryC1/StrS family aminotransferase n=1 Tax=Paenibacillus cymbidii TaxID=1639034 RepID=UPI0022A8CDAE|nr:aminotransferase class V-fold PLP-dependent enzyme [Paenibacillus cymbidii]